MAQREGRKVAQREETAAQREVRKWHATEGRMTMAQREGREVARRGVRRWHAIGGRETVAKKRRRTMAQEKGWRPRGGATNLSVMM